MRDNYKLDNPFYSNYLFSYKDFERRKITKWHYIILFFLPTYVQITPEAVFHYKLWQGRIFLMKIKKHGDSK